MITNHKIIGIGIDSVQVDRFKNWNALPINKLLKIFSAKEIEYCLNCIEKSSERFAARFAAKEAAYKALSQTMPFLKFCKYVEIKKENNIPKLVISWNNLNLNENINSFISITHTNLIATAIVVLQQKN